MRPVLNVSDTLDILRKAPPSLLSALFLASLVLLLLGGPSFREQYWPWVPAACALLFVLLLAKLTLFVHEQREHRGRRFAARERQRRELRSLSPGEAELLLPAVVSGTRTLVVDDWRTPDQIPNGLVARGIIFPGRVTFDPGRQYIIIDPYWSYFQESPEEVVCLLAERLRRGKGPSPPSDATDE
jgi:hypothetical protein